MGGGTLISFVGAVLANGQVVPLAVSTLNPLPVTLSGGIGGLSVAGTVADGALALTQFPVTVGGVDPATGLVHRLKVAADGSLVVSGASGGGNVQGTIANGAPGNPNPVVTGGLNAGNAVSSAVDASGRQIITGAGATGIALVGNPIPTGGADGGGLLRTLLMDTSGRTLVVGGAAPASALAGNPVPVAGADGGGLVRTVLTDTSGRQLVAGALANGVGVATANPIINGSRASTTNPTAVGDGQNVYVRADKTGRAIVVPFNVRDLCSQSAVVTLTTTAETTLMAQVAAAFLDMVGIKIINTSATPVRLDVRDATAGTVVDTWEIPANSTVGQSFTSPFKQTAVNNNWTVQLAAAVTDVRVVAQFAQNI